MPRDIPVSNGSLLVAFDKNYLIREIYFPHVGEENHLRKDPFRFGVSVNNKFSWIPDGWDLEVGYLPKTLVTSVIMHNRDLGLKIESHDLVDYQENIFLRKLRVHNLTEKRQQVKLFFGHDFKLYGNNIGDTAAYRPDLKGVLHYKKERYFLINSSVNGVVGVHQYATGYKGHSFLEGAWKDAEDGHLSGNPITQGAVDSVVAVHLNIDSDSCEECYYWICAGTNFQEVKELNATVIDNTPEKLLKRTTSYWRLWVNKEKKDLSLLPERVTWLYERSLLITRSQIDNKGAIIAANDSDVVEYNWDTYSYLWPRDGALVASALDQAGYSEITRRFYNFCAELLEPEGYFAHKYNPSGNLASSWHPWEKDGKYQLPIQEDETALIIWALWRHYLKYKDIEFIKPLYPSLIKKAADFMLNYRDENTKLPLPSYDLWEERQGVLTFTCSTVFAGLQAAANFANAFEDKKLAKAYQDAALEVRSAMEKYLYLPKEQRFARMLNFDTKGNIEIDKSLDASLYGLFAFSVYYASDEKVKSTMEQLYDKLWCKTEVGGLARYEGDSYYRVSENVPGNPWFITTLWYAEYLIEIATTKQEISKALEILEWVVERALNSGVLSEQVDPYTSEPLSVSPLTWSHGTYVLVVHKYLDRLKEL